MKPTYFAKKMEEPEWRHVEAAVLEHTGWLEPCDVMAKAWVCYRNDALQVRLEAWETPVRATLTGLLDSVCKDSCLEFFFAPCEDDPRYFNFEFNPLGTMFLGFGKERETRVRQIPIAFETLFSVRPFSDEDGWGVTFEIPLSFIRMYFPEFGFSGSSRCNFYKCGELTEVPHYLAWSPLTATTPDYHRWQDFGILRYE